MADRDDNVYKAKLAEQAERYDGKMFNLSAYVYVILINFLIVFYMTLISVHRSFLLLK